MKLSAYAKKIGVSYQTAHNHWKQGLLKGYQLPTGTIVVEFEPDSNPQNENNKVVLYARVSSSENKDNLQTQLGRLRDYASAKGYTIIQESKEIGSGLNDKRPILEKILKQDNWNILLVEHKDRLSRFDLNYISVLLEKQDKKIEIINEAENDRDDLMQEFEDTIWDFCTQLYGTRKSKRIAKTLIEVLKKD